MPTPRLSDEKIRRTIKVWRECSGDADRAAQILECAGDTVRYHVRQGKIRGLISEWETGKEDAPPRIGGEIEFPAFPDEDIDPEAILDTMEKRFLQRLAHQDATKWFQIKIRENKPIGICWFGDPHLGSNGCNLPLLRADSQIVSSTPGMYGANIGDTVDNWGGRLTRLYADNDVSRQTERRIARWFLEDTGIKWLLWLHGNHDVMDGAFATYLDTLNAARIPMMDWRAQFKLVFPNEREVKIDAAHNFKGHSMWNDLHGLERESKMGETADLFVAGHRHNGSYKKVELPDGTVTTLARARGYKWIDT